MYLNLGDWSGDGHDKSDQVLLESNFPVEVVQQAYKDSCKLTGIQFNNNTDYTGVKRDWEKQLDMQILTEYECSIITDEQFKCLYEHGLRVEMLAEWNGEKLIDYIKMNREGKGYYVSTESFVPLWIWFVTLSNKDLVLVKSKQHDNIPNINGYWDKNLNVGFGYGLYL